MHLYFSLHRQQLCVSAQAFTILSTLSSVRITAAMQMFHIAAVIFFLGFSVCG